MDFSGFVGENKKAVAFTLVVLVSGAAAYLAIAPEQGMPAGGGDAGVFEGTRLKVAFAADGSAKLFANARNNALSRLPALEGNPVPEDGAVVVGYSEASALKDGKLFSRPGDALQGLPGVGNVSVEGVLRETGSPADWMYFLDSNAFNAVNGEEGRAFARVAPGGAPKLFYRLGYGDGLLEKLKLAEGSSASFETHVLGNATYYPVILGAAEAKLMRAEGKFANAGDVVRGFFGRDVVVAGVLEQTGTVVDAMLFTPFGGKEI